MWMGSWHNITAMVRTSSDKDQRNVNLTAGVLVLLVVACMQANSKLRAIGILLASLLVKSHILSHNSAYLCIVSAVWVRRLGQCHGS